VRSKDQPGPGRRIDAARRDHELEERQSAASSEMAGYVAILGGVNYDLLSQHFEDGTTPLLRADFSDAPAWAAVVQAVTADADFGPSDDPDDDDGSYTPNIQAIDDRTFEGATGRALAEARDGEMYGYVLLADSRAMREAIAGSELTLVYVDLSVAPEDAEEFGDELGREFRCEVSEIASIEANLAIANMDFADFADNVDEDGVFRGFDD